MTGLGTDNLGTGQNAWHNHVSRPKLSLDCDEPQLTSEPDIYDTAKTLDTTNSTPSADNYTSGTTDATRAALVAERARQAAVRAAEAAAAAAAAKRAAQNNAQAVRTDRHFDVETEPSAEYEKVEDYELEEGAVDPELPPETQQTRVKINFNRRAKATPAASMVVTPAIKKSASMISTDAIPAERHPYQVRAAEVQAARRQLEDQILHATRPTISTQARKDQAIARALAAVQPIEQENDVLANNVSATPVTKQKLDRTHSKRQKHHKEKTGLSTGRRFLLAFSVAAVAVTGLGFLIMNSIPDISLQVAAMQVGIDATYPAYVPRGFSMTDVTSSDGRIRLTFTDNETTFVITESQSAWDTSAVLNNYVKPEWPTYTTTHENGITVYINNSNAAWVNGGIFYTIECQTGTLTKKQLANIVAGL